MAAIKEEIQRFKDHWQHSVNRLVEQRGGMITILHDAFQGYSHANGSEAAAGMTFYAVFSLFPLLAVIVTITSLFLSQQQTTTLLLTYISPVFPISRTLILENIQRFVHQRGTFGLVGAVVFFWSASGVFFILAQNINRAWEKARVRSYIQERLVGFALTGLILGLLVLGLIVTTGFNVLVRLQPSFLRNWLNDLNPLWQAGTELAAFLLTFGVFLFLYRYIPSVEVRYSEAVWGALLVSCGWALVSAVLAWYFRSGLAQYNVLYGSLAAPVVLMLWLYLNNIIILFGAHVCAAISKRRHKV